MSESETLLNLLVEWEERRRAGKSATVEELCPEDAALQAKLRSRILKREKLHEFLDVPGATLVDASHEPAPLPNIEGYEILEVLGRGGMGVVYKAKQQGLNRLVALKVISAGANAGPQERSRFRAEAEAVAALKHPNIVEIHAVGEQDGCPYLALELVHGGNLADALKQGPWLPERAARLVHALALAVHHAHERGIVHRDLKPANVLLQIADARLSGSEEVPKVTDFGLAKRLGQDLGYTQTGTILGSPSYMAPEQASGQNREVGPATDIHALGAILYELLTGRPPFLAAGVVETLEQVRFQDPVPPRILQPKLPRDLDVIALKCLEKQPAHRYASAHELARDLQAFLDGEPISARSSTWWEQVARTIGHAQVDAKFGIIGTFALCLAPLPFLIHLAVYVFLRSAPHYPQIAVAVSAVTVFLLVTSMLWLSRPVLRYVPGYQRRHALSVWLSHLVAFTLYPLIVWLMAPPEKPEHWFMLYPLWALLAGTTFFAFASYLGALYVIGCAIFALSFLMVFVPALAPLLVGLFMSLNMTTQGILLRRLWQRAKEAEKLV